MENKKELENSALKEAGLEQISGGAAYIDEKTKERVVTCDICGEKAENPKEDIYSMYTPVTGKWRYICKSCGGEDLKSLFEDKK